MCRLFGAVSRDLAGHPVALVEAPSSLAALSPQHPHGWGIAVHDGSGWSLHKSPTCAGVDARFHEVGRAARGRILIAHVRKATVGRTVLANTHPFRRDAWVFAHNGTLTDLAWLERHTSTTRAREREGDTDSERFFAFLLTVLDDAGATKGSRFVPEGACHRAIAMAAFGATARPRFGSANFLLSDGEVLYAHRFGRTLFVSRAPGVVRVVSEAAHDAAWQELPERTLLRIESGVEPVMVGQTLDRPPQAGRSRAFSEA